MEGKVTVAMNKATRKADKDYMVREFLKKKDM
jgi:hypothetical protein